MGMVWRVVGDGTTGRRLMGWTTDCERRETHGTGIVKSVLGRSRPDISDGQQNVC